MVQHRVRKVDMKKAKAMLRLLWIRMGVTGGEKRR